MERSMNLRTLVRTLATAALLALAIVSGSIGLAHAESNTSPAGRCKAGGGVWVEGRGCADQKCPTSWGGASHGDRRVVRNRVPGQFLANGDVTQECNGFTGQWVTVNAPAPSQGPTLETVETTPLVPVAPRPSRNSR
jgi:hypothetical protein